MPPSLPMTPPAATQIGGDLSMQTCKDWTTYFANLVPIDRHSAEDVRARQCRMARLHLLSGIRQEDVAHAFEVFAFHGDAVGAALPGAGGGRFPSASPGARAYQSITLDSGTSPFVFFLFHSCMAWMAKTA